MTNYLVVRLAYRHPKIQQAVEGRPTLLLLDGQMMPENLAKELRISGRSTPPGLQTPG